MLQNKETQSIRKTFVSGEEKLAFDVGFRQGKLQYENKISQELKNDLIASWNEAEELHTSFGDLTDEELIECKESLKSRIDAILHCLEKYVSEEDIIKRL